MNLYGLTEFAAYGLLVGIACVLIQQRRSYALGYWLAGWVLILIHAGLFMLMPSSSPYDVLARGTLMAAGQAFVLAAYYQHDPVPRGRNILIPAAIGAVLNVAFQVIATAASTQSPSPPTMTGLIVLLIGGVGSALWALHADDSTGRVGKGVAGSLLIAANGVQAMALVAYGPLMASQWLMCWTYIAAGLLFVRSGRRPTLGILFTALSFALWGLIFPIYTLLGDYAPNVAARVEDGVWNLPKFLAAASMILVLLEQRIVSVTHQAMHDELTGLPNRRLFERRCGQITARAHRSAGGFVLIVIDLDGFKAINDRLGHPAGDELLQTVATRLRAVVRRTDTLARTGGDEFTAVLDRLHDFADTDAIATTIANAVLEPVQIQDVLCHVTASVGVAKYPIDGTTIPELTAVADQRMYQQKSRHKPAL